MYVKYVNSCKVSYRKMMGKMYWTFNTLNIIKLYYLGQLIEDSWSNVKILKKLLQFQI